MTFSGGKRFAGSINDPVEVDVGLKDILNISNVSSDYKFLLSRCGCFKDENQEITWLRNKFSSRQMINVNIFFLYFYFRWRFTGLNSGTTYNMCLWLVTGQTVFLETSCLPLLKKCLNHDVIF